MKYIYAIIFFYAFTIGASFATTIHVPGDSLTIQAGIEGAADGDTVLVATGTYTGEGNRDIDFSGRAVVVMSEQGPEATVIDCDGDPEELTRGFYFHSGESADSKLDGFTIRNGYNSMGGAIYLVGSSPTISNCVLTENAALQSGGGICCWYAAPGITHCLFSNNAVDDDGGAIFCHGEFAPTITSCDITANSACGDGGGICCEQCPSIITACAISGNTARNQGGGISCHAAGVSISKCTILENTALVNGGGICCEGAGAAITDCTISGNSADYGGGIDCRYGSAHPMVTGSVISGNTAIVGAGIDCWESSPVIVNCNIVTNSGVWGGGIGCVFESDPVVTFCTVADNDASQGGGVYCEYDSSPSLTNCILWGNVPGGLKVSQGDPVVVYSDVQGGWSGEGNIDADPLFQVEGDYHLTQHSPCRNAGTDCGVTTDIDGQKRPNGDGFDMGSDEWYPTLVDDEQGGGGRNPPEPLSGVRLYQNHPNPFNPRTDIRYAIAKKSPVSIRIFDVRGKLVKTLVDRIEEPGEYSASWNGRNNVDIPVSSGVYTCRLEACGVSETRRMLVLK